jgi:hypothetical protein
LEPIARIEPESAQSTIDAAIANQQSADRNSPIDNPSIVNRHSPIGND